VVAVLAALAAVWAGLVAPAAGAEPPENAAASGFGPWQKVKEQEGILVHARSVAGTSIREVRGTGAVDAPLLEILAVIDDVVAYPSWMPKVRVSEVLARPAPREIVGYSRFAAPWPVADRDVVLKAVAEFNRADRSVKVTLKTVAWKGKEPPGGVVRMLRYDGSFTLRALGPERTEIDFQMLGDPAGRVPAWMANWVAREVPYKTIKRLRKRVALMRGKYATFVQRWKPEL
jgi:hypothetical protein